MAGSTSNRTLAHGGVLWGQSFNPITYVPPDDDDGVTLVYLEATKDIVDGTPLDMDGALAATVVGTDNANAYLPVAMPLHFTTVGTWTCNFVIVGRNQFGEDVTETVATTGGTIISSNWCYSFVASITPNTLSGWTTSDSLDIGYTANVTANASIPLPFKLKDVNHINSVTVNGTSYAVTLDEVDRVDGDDVTASLLYHTVIVGAGTPADFGGGTTILPVSINLTLGAQEVY